MRLCKVCTLPPEIRARIDAALADGTTYDRIVARFSQVDRPINTMNLSRHRRHLLPKDLVRRAPAPEPETALSQTEVVIHICCPSSSSFLWLPTELPRSPSEMPARPTASFHYVPVPLRVTACGLPPPSSETFAAPVLAPVIVGVNVTLTAQLAFGSRLALQVVV